MVVWGAKLYFSLYTYIFKKKKKSIEHDDCCMQLKISNKELFQEKKKNKNKQTFVIYFYFSL
jgi:hypothetical protein